MSFHRGETEGFFKQKIEADASICSPHARRVGSKWLFRAFVRALTPVLLISLGLVGLAARAQAATPNYTNMPYFKLPFQCGEQWRLSTYDSWTPGGHSVPDRQVDFFRVDGGVQFGISHTVGAAVLAAASGKVHEAFPAVGGVEIDHGGGWFTLYLHMTGITVSPGDFVFAGEKIGAVGKVGTDSDPHLHFELMFDGLGSNNPPDGDGDGDGDPVDERVYPWFEGVQYVMQVRAQEDDPRVRSTNACPGNGAPQNGTQYSANYYFPYNDNLYFAVRETNANTLTLRRWNGAWINQRFSTPLAGNPASVVFGHQLQIVGRDGSNRLQHRWYDPVTSSWGSEILAGAIGGDPDISVHAQTGQLQVVARDTTNHLHQWWFTHGQGWQSGPLPNSSDITVVGTPALSTYSVKTQAVVLPAMGDFQVTARASDGSLWMWTYDAIGGTGWQRSMTPGIGTADPSTVVYNNDLHMFVRGTDGKLWHLWRNPSTSWASEPFSVLISGTPAPIVREQELHVFARTSTSGLVDCWYNGAWRCDPLTGQISGDPKAAVYRDPYFTGTFNEQMRVVARGTDGQMWHWSKGEGEAWSREAFGVYISEPGQSTVCAAPGSWPTAKSWISIFATAAGRSGTSSSCTKVGESYTTSNPQYVWCRRWGAKVSDASGNYNHWWLWTDLDTGGRGWISAYYIQGQGNDQANGIPDCP